MQTKKKISLRKCVVSNQMYPKKELIRVVKTTNDEVLIDSTGKLNGRGAYLRPTLAIWEQAKKNRALERALHMKLSDEFYEELKKEIVEGWD
ncbi:hypothetical protein P344_05830 [Spiroplasma mirum ATCC 29335]|uniref:YlxR domain-containing protein n=1 Tax=Spiroplasma mirum ATCC 29335 TaxID=838561 RepID=W0GM60_9MOLU|nr:MULTISPECIES: YlxR family protein [Spiroplasma]AHF61350.1 hypothetical protein SMM_0974 [Spiroplasma mirum ATCC 29335]AHI58473.1 hypothetical protein P344_05830 [Spiroplasma mirum ATCC 29335]AKM53402.1 putative RNA-binding protein [Spiroplasma atrichopogonis]